MLGHVGGLSSRRRQYAMVGGVGFVFFTRTAHQVQTEVRRHGATNGYGSFANWGCTGTILRVGPGCRRYRIVSIRINFEKPASATPGCPGLYLLLCQPDTGNPGGDPAEVQLGFPAHGTVTVAGAQDQPAEQTATRTLSRVLLQGSCKFPVRRKDECSKEWEC